MDHAFQTCLRVVGVAYLIGTAEQLLERGLSVFHFTNGRPFNRLSTDVKRQILMPAQLTDAPPSYIYNYLCFIHSPPEGITVTGGTELVSESLQGTSWRRDGASTSTILLTCSLRTSHNLLNVLISWAPAATF